MSDDWRENLDKIRERLKGTPEFENLVQAIVNLRVAGDWVIARRREFKEKLIPGWQTLIRYPEEAAAELEAAKRMGELYNRVREHLKERGSRSISARTRTDTHAR